MEFSAGFAFGIFCVVAILIAAGVLATLKVFSMWNE